MFETSEYAKINKDSLLPMGITSENVAEKYGITRKDQDEMAVRSNLVRHACPHGFSLLPVPAHPIDMQTAYCHSRQNAAKAQETGLFDREIVPVKTILVDKQTGEEMEVVIDKDDSIRPTTTYEKLAKLPPGNAATADCHRSALH